MIICFLVQLMTVEQRKCFEEMAKLDTERFNREMMHYIPPSSGIRRGRRRKRIKDPSMPKRSWSAFFFFCDAFRSKIRSEHPDWKVSDIAKELGRRWEECTDKERYERRAQNDKLRYEQDMQKYKAGLYVATKRARVEDYQSEPETISGIHDQSNHTERLGETSQISGDEQVSSATVGGEEDEDDEEEEGEEGDDEEPEEEEDDDDDDDNDEEDNDEDENEQSRSNAHKLRIGHKASDQIVSNDTNNNTIMNTRN
ncbi:unnamed protein product [Heterobilharzia americana]|nr:unnamed protein product [Heterobilharzia americana]